MAISLSKDSADIKKELAEVLNGPADSIELTPMRTSQTKESYKIIFNDEPLFVKRYFQGPNRTTDRLDQEWAYLTFLKENGISNVPSPISYCPEKGIGVYSYIEGKAPKPSDFQASLLDEALSFHLAVNVHRQDISTEGLTNSLDAAFSINDHMERVELRISRLQFIIGNSQIEKKCKNLVESTLEPLWADIRDHLQVAALLLGTPSNISLSPIDYCLSPADFGFHNCMIDCSGKLFFVDFEYAGWDDPARMIGDFFHHPSYPLPYRYHKRFMERALSIYRNPDWHIERCAILEPVHMIKWCCILLNPFLPIEATGQNLHIAKENQGQLKADHLLKAEQLLEHTREKLSELT
ncbi:MAG: aminoglycoside phosphotransferase family protein [Verrucomicrobiota bacterium]